MSTQAGIVGTGIIARLFVVALFSGDEKISGALLGILNGFLAHYAYRTDQLLEPLVLVEVIFGTCFDAIYQVSTEKLVALALGGGIGILCADTLPVVWDDYAEPTLTSVKIKDDFDATEALSELSEDVTYSYEEYTITRPITTEAWIAAQRKQRSTKSTSAVPTGVSSSFVRNLQTSGANTPTRMSRLSTKAQLEDGTLLLTTEPTVTPSPAPSVSRSSRTINIDVEAPSAASKSSTSTVKASVRAQETTEAVETRSSRVESRQGSRRSAAKVSTKVSSSSTSSSSRTSIRFQKKGTSTKIDGTSIEILSQHMGFSPSFTGDFSPLNMPQSVRSRSSLHTLSRSHSQSHSRSRSRSYSHSRSRTARSVGTAVKSPHIDKSQPQFLESENIARSSSRLTNIQTERIQTPLGSAYLRTTPVRSARAVSPNREVIINYTDDATKIIIPPPSPFNDPGFNVRIIPQVDNLSVNAEILEPEKPNLDSLGLRGVLNDGPPFSPHRSQASFPELSIVPADEERRSEGTQHHSSHGHTSSEPQAPSIFKLKTAWRDDDSPLSPSLDSYTGQSEKPFPIHDDGNLTQEFEFEVAKSINSLHNDDDKEPSEGSRRPLPVEDRRHSMNTAYTSSLGRRGIGTIDMNYDNAAGLLGETKSPSIEFYHPNGSGTGVVVDDRDERTTSSHRYRRVRGRTRSRSFVTSSTVPESILSHGRTAAFITEAHELRKQARNEEARIAALQQERKEAQDRGQHTLAFKLGYEIDIAKEKVRNLYRKAERRMYAGGLINYLLLD